MIMNFDEAFEAMRKGAAIRRPHWKGVSHLFYQHGRTYAVYKSGHSGTFLLWDDSCIGDDWQIVDNASTPTMPPPITYVPPKNPRGFADNLTDKQLEMKARWKAKRVG
jgi:hypothetical protein